MGEGTRSKQAGQVHRVDSVFDLETKSVLMIPSFWHSVQVSNSVLCPANILLSVHFWSVPDATGLMYILEDDKPSAQSIQCKPVFIGKSHLSGTLCFTKGF